MQSKLVNLEFTGRAQSGKSPGWSRHFWTVFLILHRLGRSNESFTSKKWQALYIRVKEKKNYASGNIPNPVLSTFTARDQLCGAASLISVLSREWFLYKHCILQRIHCLYLVFYIKLISWWHHLVEIGSFLHKWTILSLLNIMNHQ